MALPDVPPITFTDRDYLSIRQEMLGLTQRYMPEYTDLRPSDFGVHLIGLEAAMLDVLHFYVDRCAAERLPDFAVLLDSTLALMKLIGYQMAGSQAASTMLAVTAADNVSSALVLEQGAQFGSGPYTFETTENKIFQFAPLAADSDSNTDLVFVVTTANFVVGDTVGMFSSAKKEELHTVIEVNTSLSAIRVDSPFSDGFLVDDGAVLRIQTGLVPAKEGTTISNEILGSSTGAPGMEFTLRSTPFIENSEVISIYEGAGYVQWQRTSSLFDSGPTDRHYEMRTVASGQKKVVFGDGKNGMIPPVIANGILATYRVGGGAGANDLSAGSVNRLISVPAWVKSCINRTAPAGGADPETPQHAAIYGPKSVRTNDRAVTAEDFATIALGVPGVEKAITVSREDLSPYTAATYIAPVGGGAPNPELKLLVKEALDEKRLLCITNLVLDPTYVNIQIQMIVRVKTNFLAATVKQTVEDAVLNFFQLDKLDFGLDLYRSDLTGVLEAQLGVDSIVYTQFSKTPVVNPVSLSGNATFGPVTIGTSVKAETFTVTMTSHTDFTVVGSVSGSIGTGTLGTLFSVADVLSFTILAGSNPMQYGDSWAFNTSKYEDQTIVIGDVEIGVLTALQVTTDGGQ